MLISPHIHMTVAAFWSQTRVAGLNITGKVNMKKEPEWGEPQVVCV